MHEIARKISDFLISNGALEEKRKIYEYALICLLNEVFVDFLLLVSAAFWSAVPEMIIWILVLNSMRMNIGGLHANTPELCSFLSYVLGMCSVIIGVNIKLKWNVIITLVVFSIVSVYKMAPVIHPNRPISEQQKKVARKRALIFLVGWTVAWNILYRFWIEGVMCGIIAMVGSIVLMIISRMSI